MGEQQKLLRRIGARVVVMAFFLVACWPQYLRAADEDLPSAFWRGVFARPEPSHAGVDPVLQQRQSLGAQLFSDVRLSGDGKRACASCHKPDLAFTDGRRLAEARPNSQATLRHTPTLYNLKGAQAFNWDGSAPTLERQALGPLESEAELAAKRTDVIHALKADQEYVARFARAFPDTPEISTMTLTKALAAYVRSLASPRTRFDLWIEGSSGALNSQQRRGFRLFVGKAGCVACHAGWGFKDDQFHDIGLPETGVSLSAPDISGLKGVRAFKTPTLRSVIATAPYMHDGSIRSLENVVEHYATGVVARKGLSASMPRNLNLTAKEKEDLVSFLKTL